MDKKVLIIGNGGREHAICWKISQSKHVKSIYVAPGSYGISHVEKVENVNLNLDKNFQEVVDFCQNKKIDLVIVGPEDPLSKGLANVLNKIGVNCFGPEILAAQIESDKSWAKAFMDKYDIPTAKWKSFTNSEDAKSYIKCAKHKALVVKASGLAAGKGVVVAKDVQEACDAVDEILSNKKFGNAGSVIVIEELLEGEEVSLLAFTDGYTIKPMLPAQDHKRIGENDEGLNTGGMGAYCPYPLNEDTLKYVEEHVLNKAVNGFQKEKLSYVGVLYAGLMLTKDGPKVLEFNCRFGDPETQVLLPLLKSDLYEIMNACCTKSLSTLKIEWNSQSNAVGVVMASRGYPETSSKGQVIKGIEKVITLPDFIVFHSGTALNEKNELITNGGRVLIAVALAPSLPLAAAKATKACSLIDFDGKQFRRDISHKGIIRSILQFGDLSYKKSGVDIVAGDNLVSKIKPLAKSTARLGLMGGLGGFGGLFDMKAAKFQDPILVSGTDGVGTKLKIAQTCGIHSTIGIDLVAMCVNDVLAHGAEPLFFLDYFSCGALDINVATDVVSGIAEGCRQAKCALVGGETAEMPGMYPVGEYDLAGFAVGAVERNQMIPRLSDIKEDDVVIGFPSSGIHSNGFSLVRKVMEISGLSYGSKAPFSSNTGNTLGQELLTPTKIYVQTILPLIKAGYVKAFAHITGGGLVENIPRILPDNLKVILDNEKWKIPPVFGWLAAIGGVNEYEMLRTFNCGIGVVIIVKQENVESIFNMLKNEDAFVIGSVKQRNENEAQVLVSNFSSAISNIMKPHIFNFVNTHCNLSKKKVAVLISGSGTNLQTLINATKDPTQRINAEIVLVISNKSDVEGVRRAERANIPVVIVKHTEFSSRDAFDDEMDRHLALYGVELVCLAGFMRILSAKFVRKWHGKLINIHPSLLPLFKGIHAQKEALEAGVKLSGCTVHYVDVDIDAGAIICQESVPVLPTDTEFDLTERIKAEAEQKAYPKALKLISSGEISLGPDNKIQYH